jgi:hypothetical protein
MARVWQHNAPPAFCVVGNGRYLRRALWLAWGLGLLAALGWLLPADGARAAGWRCALLLLTLLCSALWLKRCVRGLPAGVLHWNGRIWHWQPRADSAMALQSGGAAGVQLRLEPVWDLQQALLLRVQRVTVLRSAPQHWLWLERPRDMELAAWLAFRRAVYCRARDEPLAPDEAKPS